MTRMDMKAFEAEASAANEVDIEGRPLKGTVHPWLRPAVLDRIEQAAIVVLWMLMVRRFLPAADSYTPLVLISETAVMLFTVVRRPTKAISLDLGDWLLAITATAAPLCIVPGPDLIPGAAHAGLALLFVGNLLQLMAKLTLARSFGIAPANRGLKIEGPYRFVRHPMYAGYLLVHIGVLVLITSPLNALVYAIGWTAQIRRLLAEEALLSRDPAYRDYAAKVRWRLIPGIF